ncbi:MAG TPA: hypothetical protein VGM83_11100 [Devosiaceae bacterium]|jgi:hypothetical protein
MSAIILRVLIYVLIAAALYLGLRKIWRDTKNLFRSEDKARHQRDIKERQQPDVITLKRDGDGVFRPPGDDDRR